MISVAIITKNEAHNIERCLRSVQWADEIVVVDAYSDDATPEIGRRWKATVHQRPWDGYAAQKEFALSQCSHDWALSIDADEVVTDALREEIMAVVNDPHAANGYRIPRRSYFLGAWMRHGGWYPGYQLRLFRRSKTRMNRRPVHEGFLTDGPVGTLRAPLDHFTYADIAQYVTKMNDYTSLDVANKLSGGLRVRWYHFLLNPLSVFLRMFLSLAGWKDGLRGFLLAAYSSLSTLTLYAKCWEYQTAHRRGMPLPPVTNAAIEERKRLAS